MHSQMQRATNGQLIMNTFQVLTQFTNASGAQTIHIIMLLLYTPLVEQL